MVTVDFGSKGTRLEHGCVAGGKDSIHLQTLHEQT
jgi:hypothetical protein